jgi:hypothetical protein
MPAKILRVVILLLITGGGLAFAVLAVRAATGRAGPRFAAAAFGVALLAAGASGLSQRQIIGLPQDCSGSGE